MTSSNIPSAPTARIYSEYRRKIPLQKKQKDEEEMMETCLNYKGKTATEYPVVDEIKNRWSPRAFSEKAVEHEKLLSLLDAARYAPSSFNEQPWHFIVTTKENRSNYDRLLQCLSTSNQQWASSAPVLLMSVASTRLSRNDKLNRHSFHDVGLATGNLLVQATALGLHAHMMGGFNMEKAKEAFDIPEGYEPVAAIAIGYLGNSEILTDKMRKRKAVPGLRKELAEFLHGSSWGEMPELLN